MTPDAKLDALFAAARPPARDHAFEATVAQHVARRRAWGTVGALTPWAVAGAAVLWGLRPALASLLESVGPAFEPAGATLAGAAVVAGCALWLSQRFSRA